LLLPSNPLNGTHPEMKKARVKKRADATNFDLVFSIITMRLPETFNK